MKNYLKQDILGQPSFVMRNDCVELAVTEMGGNMAPVTFGINSDNPQQPYFFCPWTLEGLPLEHSYMDVFRGDFLCLPFARYGDGPMHGESSGRKWNFVSCEKEDDRTVMKMTLQMEKPYAELTKVLTLADGQNVVYISHIVEKMDGYFSYAHHATMNISPEREGIISHSPIHFAYTTDPRGFYNERESTYMFALGGEKIEDMTKVPTVFKDPEYVDCSHVPTVLNYSGALQIYAKVQDTPSWTCIWFPKQNFVWYALKNAKKQPITHFWLEFGGRYQYPWNGRTMAIAVEDMNMAIPPEAMAPDGRMSKRFDKLKEAGIDLHHKFSPDEPFNLNYIEGVAFVGDDFGKVADIEFGDGEITLVSETGNRTTTPVNWKYCLE